MKLKLKIVAAAVCVVGLLALGAAKSPEDLAAMQGTWNGELTADGQTGKCSAVVKGATVEFHGPVPSFWFKATFSLREDTNPKQLVTTFTESGTPEAVGASVYAIYQIKDDSLTIVVNVTDEPKPPASFDAPGTQKVVLKRTSAAPGTKK